MSGLQNKLDTVRDSIASLFKRRKGRAKNGGISTPQNVKRVMHITFDSDNQSFNGIPNQWRPYFEGHAAEAAAASGPETVEEEETTKLHDQEEAAAAEAAAAVAEFAPERFPSRRAESTLMRPPIWEYSDQHAESEENPIEGQSSVGSPSAEYANWSASRGHLAEGAIATDLFTSEHSIADGHDASAEGAPAASAGAAGIVRKSSSRAPRELLSLVYDRDHGQFVNLPPHWEERLQRNNLLEPEFQSNPKLLAMVFSLMDHELRSMRAEGERVESCLYSSLPRRQSSRATQDRGHPPHYVFRIEADKSNSSSDWDLTADHPAELVTVVTTPVQHLLDNGDYRKGSFVTVKAVEVPDELDSEML